jgi:septal ring factor EnvC (AmiA/AmiB activator)
LAALDQEAAAKETEFKASQAREMALLSALEKLSQNPPEAMLFGPASPIEQMRGAMMLGAAVPRLQAEAQALSAAISDLKRLKAQIAGKRLEMAQKQTTLDAERQRIAQMIRQKAALEGETREAKAQSQKKLDQLSAQASDLKDLILRLERERQERLEQERKRAEEARLKAEREVAARAQAQAEKAQAAKAEADRLEAEKASQEAATAPSPGQTQVAAAIAPPRPKGADPLAPRGPGRKLEQGRMLAPAAGQIIKQFGDDDGFSSAKGLTFRTRPGAEVVAPFDGQIEFAGPFKGYGQILIIDHGGGYHSLLAGIEQIEGSVGQKVVAGEPVGTMRSGEPAPSLYLELRRQGQPINPLPWLVARDGKVSG